eukprot:359394_1
MENMQSYLVLLSNLNWKLYRTSKHNDGKDVYSEVFPPFVNWLSTILWSVISMLLLWSQLSYEEGICSYIRMTTPAWVSYGSLATGYLHVWVEVTFEIFTIVIIAFLYREMGIITKAAERLIFRKCYIFIFIGISHNFYWIAKP